MNKLKNTDPIIVIIATSLSRTNLLLERSLKSVYEQTNINPHQVYIVDDNPIKEGASRSGEYFKIDKGIKTLRDTVLKPKYVPFKQQRQTNDIKFENFFHTNLIQNTRTKGYSGTGAWNSGAFKALQYSDKNYFLAFLDDDDEWESNYLETLYKSVVEPEKEKIDGKLKNIRTIASVAGFLRIEDKKEIKIQAHEETFTKDNFFIGNAGLQASNLFIGLKTFWTIGGFDESLKSATDRDLAIRLIQHEKIRPSNKIRFIDEILVKHYATSENRVTTNLDNKKEGLDVFYRKYFHQFSEKLQKKSLARANKLFNYDIATKQNKVEPTEKQPKNETREPFNLIIGAISGNAENLTKLFKSFLSLYNRHGKLLNNYRFLILDNTDNEYKIKPVINYFFSQKKLKIESINSASKDDPIAKNRTLLQKEVYKKGKKLFGKNYVSWIIDDDHLFKCDTHDGIVKPDYFKVISEQLGNDIDAMFGQNSDAPPLPFLNTLRTQLIDFYYNLTYFANCKPDEKFELNKYQQSNIELAESYYDLSNKNFQHLEYPYYEQTKATTNCEAFKDFLKQTSSLADGVNVFRKMTYAPETIGVVKKESIFRGGNTIIFNPELLKTPNFTPKYTPKAKYNRRSDFNWSIINKHIFKRKLCAIVLPLKHDRKLQKTSLLSNENKLEADIKGLIFYRLFENILSQENWESKTEYEKQLKFYKKIQKEAFLKIKISNYRTQSLIYLILDILKDVKLWWFKNKYRENINYDVQQNIFLMEVLKFELGKRKFQVFLKKLEKNMKIDDAFIERVMAETKKIKESSTNDV